MTTGAYLTERKNRRVLAEHAYQLVSAALQVEDFDDSTLVTYQDGFHIQFGFSAMHPLLVMCLVRPMSPPAEEQLDITPCLAATPSTVPTTATLFASPNGWMQNSPNNDCLKSCSVHWRKPKKDIPSSLLALDKTELCNYISMRGGVS